MQLRILLLLTLLVINTFASNTNYIVNKQWNNTFGNTLPLAMANAFYIKILIISSTGIPTAS